MGVTDVRPFFVAGKQARGSGHLPVTHPPDGSHLADVSLPTAEQVDQAVQAAADVQAELATLPARVRANALEHVSALLARRRQEVAEVITSETGKPIRWSLAEVQRAVATFRIAAEEARRFSGELMRLDTEEGSDGRMAIVRRFSRGPVLAVAPFNFPLNLVAHKVAPALAVGAPVIVKPAPKTPLSALLLGEILAKTDLPAGAWSVLPLLNEQMPALVQDPRIPVVSFTGSAEVGWRIRESVPRKHVTLELGGNGTAIVCADYRLPGDVSYVAQRVAQFAMYQAGQSCISVQQVLVAQEIHDEVRDALVEEVRRQSTGSVWDGNTSVGPLIDVDAARRVQSWVEEAVSEGAKILVGGMREGSVYAPTVLSGTTAESKVVSEEVFGPVLSVIPVANIDEAFARVNASRYGLQVGVFTHDLDLAFRAHRELQVGGVIVGDVPSFRADQMPYGGVKDSGVGREGILAAMSDLTDERTLVVKAL